MSLFVFRSGQLFQITSEQLKQLRNRKRTRKTRSERYADFLASPEWAIVRENVLLRDKGRCQICRANEATEAHHLRYDLGWNNISCIIAVCRDCHRHVHHIPPSTGTIIWNWT
jgi:5-methylcytosine-specific restriction endonuclease McrA